MLTIEEQIERIADEAVRRAGAPVRANRWPAIVAAAALVSVFGAAAWIARARSNDRPTVAAPATSSSTSTPVVSSHDQAPERATAVSDVVVPTVLPDGWRVFAVSRTSWIGPPTADQVFGRYEEGSLHGLRAVVTQQAFLGVGEGAEQIELRGQTAGIFEDTDGWHVQWGESGVLVDVTARGLDRATLLAALDGLRFRTTPISGFQPTSAPADLPLVSESLTDETTPQVMTGFRLLQGDTLPDPNDGASEDTMSVWISDRSGLFGSAPEVAFNGRPEADLVVATDRASSHGLQAVLPDGTIVVIRLPEDADLGVARTILDGLAVRPAESLVSLADDASALLAELPEVASMPIDDTHVLRVRGGTIEAPDAVCLDVGGVERCKLALVPSPYVDSSWVNSILIDGRWFLYGFESASGEPLTIAPWRNGQTFDPLEPTSAVTDGVRSWFIEVPADVDDVRILDLLTAEGQQTTFRRPDR